MIENHSYLTFIPKFGSLGGRAIPHWIGGGHAVLINHFDLFNEITLKVNVDLLNYCALHAHKSKNGR